MTTASALDSAALPDPEPDPDAPVPPGTGLRPAGRRRALRPAAPGTGGNATVTVLPRPSANIEELTLVRVMAGRICQAAMEVLAGTRPIAQLARWLDQDSFDALLVRSTLVRAAQKNSAGSALRTLHHSATVRSIHCCPVAAGVYEASLVVAEAQRSRAVALRLVQTRGVWKVTALEIG